MEQKYKNGRAVQVDDQVAFPDASGTPVTGKVIYTHSDGIVVQVDRINQKIQAETALHADDAAAPSAQSDTAPAG